MRPWCVDLFADADLRAHCPALAADRHGYPRSLLRHAVKAPPGPWLYTGALENHPQVVQTLSLDRRLWGNDAKVLRAVRSPDSMARVLAAAGVPHLAVCTEPGAAPRNGSWLIKPVRGAGGRGIAFWKGVASGLRQRGTYIQEYRDGDPCAAVFVGDGRDAALLGVSRQLIGALWLHAAPFQYAGSVGPVTLELSLQQRFAQIGNALTRGFGLRGLFGVDCVLADGVPWPVEVNPRYTASVEVLEYATGHAALALHRHVFDGGTSAPPWAAPAANSVVGKAILFARADLTVPHQGPWQSMLERPVPVGTLPPFADVPEADQPIQAGAPILTCFARAASVSACLDDLKQITADLDRWLFGR
jgi:predicted ATP-grasp superfamily ATP-dependent carboligase